MPAKSTVEEIRARFDRDVDRFSNLETGQTAAVDAPLALDLIAEAAAVTTPHARRLLDIGCGAGNYSLKVLERLPGLDVTFLDLSRPMLDRAVERVRVVTAGTVRAVQADIRDADLAEGAFDVVVAGAVFHHLRGDGEWRDVVAKVYRAVAPGGSVWVFDLVDSDLPAVRAASWARYGKYLEGLKGPAYRDEVFAYVEQEDTPRSVVYQLDLLRAVGFAEVEVLHKSACFAAFGAVKR
jgi:tRNA (cmo5U34)-methyltransferase